MTEIATSLGSLAVQTFLRDYWQRKAVFLPQACAGFSSPLTPEELAGMSLEEVVESRLVIERDGVFELENGPLPEDTFASLPESGWTLLVQAVDLWADGVSDLYDWFNFLPRWRFDDIMISYAVPGGGVGPHFDQYDVFLVQVSGHRQWRLGGHCDAATPIDDSSGLRLLKDFHETERIDAGPGDVLYVPPGVAHWGVATDDCLTFSVGLRAPTRAEMLSDLAVELILQDDTVGYRDPSLTPDMAIDEVSPGHIDAVRDMLRTLADDEELLENWFLQFMTEPRYPDLLDKTGEERQARGRGGRWINGIKQR